MCDLIISVPDHCPSFNFKSWLFLQRPDLVVRHGYSKMYLISD